MKWIEYEKDLNLFEEFNKEYKPMTQSEKYKCVRVLIEYFSKDSSWKISRLPDTYEQRREILRGLLNVYPVREIDVNILNMLHRLLLSEHEEKTIVDVNNLEEVEENIAIYRGDITNLKADAIVNAANSKLLGCLKPLHECIDNSIHSNAGPRLREDCNKIIEKQQHLEYTGQAKITRAYCLPSKFVIHTVGPFIHNEKPSKEEKKQLVSCYKSCLNIVKEIDEIKNIVFCCISTGVFGYPKDQAAKIAISTVRDWLEENTNKNIKVIFNVFSHEDEEIYKSMFRKLECKI
ncbi:protein-ADP-ribose hydrolase [Romboutsia weinsteinii]|uniref:Protein-ADP-ribose hydrolase n=1 Tax=Romboutsia weinsteinii TaxID=2020949 RepID=A0A371J388_9FIRM|nr:protein-ADP-ribose hydrolase [Romboutsia weinsteinii]RDY27163.1 protein-ADP-ribose hydrolase [Romboutsia weinsteinii]